MKKLIDQILFDFKAQPVMGIVSVIGTALAILLVMTVTIVYEVDYAPIAPEGNRDRLLYDRGIFLQKDGGSSACGSISLEAIDKLYRPIKDVETLAVVSSYAEAASLLSDDGKTRASADLRQADGNIWKVFDYRFISGRPFSADEVSAGRSVAVITESVARKLFNTPDAAGHTFRLRGKEYKVTGVVEDISPVMKMSYAGVWTPIEEAPAATPDMDAYDRWMGEYAAILLLHDKADIPKVRREAHRLHLAFNKELAIGGLERVDLGAPFTQIEMSQLKGNNNPPDMDFYYQLRIILVAIFLLFPAINLSSMTQGRLRRRRHEIGVRRAFGASWTDVLMGILRENFVVTLLGGIIGFILSMVVVKLNVEMLFDNDSWEVASMPLRVTAGMLFRPALFGWTLLFCFVLNLLSAGIPALRAARVSPVEALNYSEK